jgi:hypothetical protein
MAALGPLVIAANAVLRGSSSPGRVQVAGLTGAVVAANRRFTATQRSQPGSAFDSAAQSEQGQAEQQRAEHPHRDQQHLPQPGQRGRGVGLSPMIVRAPYSTAPTSDRSATGAVDRAAASEAGAVVPGAGRAAGRAASGG